MTNKTSIYLALDVGDARIGVAKADSATKIAFPVTTLEVDGSEIERVRSLVATHNPDVLVVGYPRNQSGDPTEQTSKVVAFIERIQDVDVPIAFQDESLTSVHAEQNLKLTGKPYVKADIDAAAAALILHDFVEQRHG